MGTRKIKKKKKVKTEPIEVKSSAKAPAFIKDIKDKVRIVFYGDAPPCATGFATVARNVLNGLHATGRYEIDILGINYWGDPHEFPHFRIWPTGTNQEKDPYGRQKVLDMIPHMEFDILFFLQDSFILNFVPKLLHHLKSSGRKFTSLCYFPIDGVPKREWIDSVMTVDFPVTYTQFAYNECLKHHPSLENRLKTIPHGVNPNDFHPLDSSIIEPFRMQYFGPHVDKYIYMNLNRNQQRKDIPRSLLAHNEVHKLDPETLLYLHMAVRDQGWNLDEVVKGMGLDMTSDVVFPNNFSPNKGFPLKTLNAVYNATDCVISTALGEGWGLSWIEAMATKTPVIMPNNTALTENITDDIGYLVDSGTSLALHTVLPWDNEVVRPVVDTNHLVELMHRVKDKPEEAKEKAENAYKHVINNLLWREHVVPMWVKLLDDIVTSGPPKQEVTEDVEGKKTILTESF
jgi:glycosyltransferase involved in cell wall biosynthesis